MTRYIIKKYFNEKSMQKIRLEWQEVANEYFFLVAVEPIVAGEEICMS